MTLRIFSLADGSGGLGASSRIFTNFDPRNLTAFGDASFETVADRPLLRDLQSLYFVWRNLSRQFDYVGFETAAHPLLIDPLAHEESLSAFPGAAGLRAAHFVNWQVPVLPVSAPAWQGYAAMRSAFTPADYDRIEQWVAGFDVITTPVCDGLNNPLRREFFKERWPIFVDIVRDIGVFGEIPEAFFVTSALWPWHNSFIMKSELFEPFIGPAFEAIFEFERRHGTLLNHGADLFMERLLGLYRQYLIFSNPLTRVTELPILLAVPDGMPQALPVGFDPVRYLEFNPDVAAAGIPAAVHFLVNGYREMRRWAP